MTGQFHSNLPNFALIKIKLQLSNSLIKADWERWGGGTRASRKGRDPCLGDLTLPFWGPGSQRHWAWCGVNVKHNRHIGMEDQWIYETRRTEEGAKVWVFPGTEPPALPWPPGMLPPAPLFNCAVRTLFAFHLPLCLSLLSKPAARAMLPPSTCPRASCHLLNAERIPSDWPFLPFFYRFIPSAVR